MSLHHAKIWGREGDSAWKQWRRSLRIILDDVARWIDYIHYVYDTFPANEQRKHGKHSWSAGFDFDESAIPPSSGDCFYRYEFLPALLFTPDLDAIRRNKVKVKTVISNESELTFQGHHLAYVIVPEAFSEALLKVLED
ncbi:hypothetical protein BZG36_01070 [Bifiguratus adelaidae]|uniref:Uncharacterized protein n=1 Tax=Bifiguratus adelaidae TaxID=1938954 RepID=A0A261Y604_9FUNG|nr:hypothetical protein BZG36_01070 [Bifiguratus adelaidae]